MAQGTSRTSGPANVRAHRREEEKNVHARQGERGGGMAFESQVAAKSRDSERVKEARWNTKPKIQGERTREERIDRMVRECAGGTHCQGHSRRTRGYPVAARREATRRAATLPILFSWLDALQCAARALRIRLLIYASRRSEQGRAADRRSW